MVLEVKVSSGFVGEGGFCGTVAGIFWNFPHFWRNVSPRKTSRVLFACQLAADLPRGDRSLSGLSLVKRDLYQRLARFS